MLKSSYRNLLLLLISPCRISLVWIPWCLCIGGFLLSVFLNYPGTPVMLMLLEARTGIIVDLHPPIMAATLRFMFHICPNEQVGLGILYVIENLLFWTGLLLVLLRGKRFWTNHSSKRYWMIAATLIPLIALWIDLLTTTPLLSKDLLHFACLLLATGLLLNMPHKTWQRFLVGMVILVLLYYGTALRYNAIFGLLPLLYWLSRLMIPSGKWIPVVSACLLWGAFIFVVHVINYHVLHAYRLYSLHERFYADIFMLNYFGKNYENPPNGFRNNFDDVTEDIFRANYLYRHMYVPDAFRYVAKETGRSYNLVFEGVPIQQGEGPKQDGYLRESDIQSFADDYVKLRNVWIRRILQEPIIYTEVRAYFVLRFLFIDTPPAFMLVTGGFLNGVSLLVAVMILSLHVKRLSSPFLVLAWSAALNGLPLFVFLPEDGPGNIRYLYWFYAASFISITYFCSQSVFFGKIVQVLQESLEELGEAG